MPDARVCELHLQEECLSLPTRKIYLTIFSLIAVLIALSLGLHLLQHVLTQDQTILSEAPPKTSPRDQNEFESGQLLKAYLTSQNEVLNTTGEVKAGFRRIPIEQAMEWMVTHKTLEVDP